MKPVGRQIFLPIVPNRLDTLFWLEIQRQDFERKSARKTVQQEHRRETSDVILALKTLNLNVNLKGIPCRKKMTQNNVMFELLEKKPQLLCVREITAKIEESPAKKETAGSQPDAFLTSDLFLLS